MYITCIRRRQRVAYSCVHAESPIWLLVEVAPIADANEQLVFMLLTFRDITAVKVPIEEDSKGLSKFARLARSITRNRALLSAGSPLSVGASPSPAASVSLPSSAFDKSLGAGAGLAGTPTGSAPTPIALSKPAEIAASAVRQELSKQRVVIAQHYEHEHEPACALCRCVRCRWWRRRRCSRTCPCISTSRRRRRRSSSCTTAPSSHSGTGSSCCSRYSYEPCTALCAGLTCPPLHSPACPAPLSLASSPLATLL